MFRLTLITLICVAGLKGAVQVATIRNDADGNGATLSTLELLNQSRAAFESNDLFIAALKHYEAAIRFRYDTAVFAILNSDNDDILDIFQTLLLDSSQRVLPRLARHPELLTKLLIEVEKWTPGYSEEFSPGWRYAKKQIPENKSERIQSIKHTVLNPIEDLKTLISKPDYLQCLIIVQDTNGQTTNEAMLRERKAALVTMREIERAVGLNGVSSAFTE